MANQSPIRPEGGMRIPLGYPNEPMQGKISILFDANKRELYHRLSPYTTDSFFFLKSREPFIYRFPDEKQGTMAKYAKREFAFASATEDVERMAKFLVSGNGILWLGKQFLLQTGNAFNETRLFNPAAPLLGAALPLSFWAFRPQRHIALGGIGSIIGSFLGPGIGSIFSTRTEPPPGTVGLAGLASNNLDAGKGLLRAGTANKALTNLETKWSGPSTGKGLGLGGFLSNTIKELFGNFIPKRQNGVTRRSDENAYGLMIASYSGNEGVFSYQGVTQFIDGVNQFWFAGSSDLMRKGGKIPQNWKKIYVGTRGIILRPPSSNVTIPGLTGEIGYDVIDTSKAVKYGDHVGTTKDNDWAGSDVLIQHSIYVQEQNKFPSKHTDKSVPTHSDINESLKRVIDGIQESRIYKVNTTAQSSILPLNQDKIGYDRILAMKNPKFVETQYRHSVLEEYRTRNVRVLEDKHTDDSNQKSMKMATSRRHDGINILTVLDGESVRSNEWEVWQPYRDDIIAFYFYDVVNDKYIPFRATIRGLQETDSATWEELSFIGRADRLYSYSGFNRSLTFSFTININSIVELAPTWQRINYLVSLVKPSSYTQKAGVSNYNNLHTRFIVPPMVMLTVGDLYKNQPIILGSAGITIPDTALWETLNEHNSTEWSYLADYIKAPTLGKMYGQLPKTVDVSVNCYLLEKERAIAGSANFGHAPHTERYEKDQYRTTAPDFANPSELHKSLVVYNSQKAK
jgi:hypothetical protein